MKYVTPIVAAALLAAGCGPSAAARDEAAVVLAGFLCTSDYLETLNPLNPAGSMTTAIPKFAAHIRDNGVTKKQVASIRSFASAGESQVDALVQGVAGKMSATCSDRKADAFAIGFLISMTDQVAVLRDAGI